MVEIDSPTATAATLPLAPRNPLPYRQQVKALRSFIDGHQRLRDAGGTIIRVVLGPRWLVPPVAGHKEEIIVHSPSALTTAEKTTGSAAAAGVMLARTGRKPLPYNSAAVRNR